MPIPKKTQRNVELSYKYLRKALVTNRLNGHQEILLSGAVKSLRRFLDENVTQELK